MNTDMLVSAKNGTLRAGKNDLVKHLMGKRLTRNQAIKAKCYDCNGMGELGTCNIVVCPLYPFSPYRQKATEATFMRREAKKGDK